MREEDIDKMIDEEIDAEASDAKVTGGDEFGIEWIESERSSDKKKKFNKLVIYDVARYIIMAIALVVFGYASYELTLIYVESAEGEEAKDEAADMFLVDYESLLEDYEPATDEQGEIIMENQGDGKLFVFDYEKMLQYNSEAKGYIRQDNGEYIDNPILQHSDNDYYLHHLANHTKSTLGAIFIDAYIEEGLEARNCIIYGHNIGRRAGNLMFGSLNWYYNKTGYYEEHPTFDIWIENRRYRYYVFSVYKTTAVASETYTYDFESDEDFLEYVENCKKKSKYKFKQAPEITADSKIITLSTCTNTESDKYRMIIQLVRGERLDVYGNPIEDDAEYESEYSTEKETSKTETQSTEQQTTTAKPVETQTTTPQSTTQQATTPQSTTPQATTPQTTTQQATTPQADTTTGATTPASSEGGGTGESTGEENNSGETASSGDGNGEPSGDNTTGTEGNNQGESASGEETTAPSANNG